MDKNKAVILLAAATFLYWAALPPVGCWPLAFLAPVLWTVLIEQKEPLRFRTVYVSALVFWFASIWWIACPHPLTSIGLLALAGYLSIYWPLFFCTARIAVHRFRIPVVLAAPVCWIGCEYLRNHLLGGFSFCSLEHALYLKPQLIQIADFGGGYLVGGLVVLVGTGIGTVLSAAMLSKPETTAKKSLPPGFYSALFAVTVLLTAFWYGRSGASLAFMSEELPLRIAVCQGNVPVRLNADPEDAGKTFNQFVEMTVQAARKAKDEGKPLDLVIWPETVCPIPLLKYNENFNSEQFGWTDEMVEYWEGQFEQLRDFARRIDTPLLVGLSTLVFEHPPEPKRLNSALLIDPKAETVGPRYDKVQLVMFGEYIPFSSWLPKNFFLKTLCQEAGRGNAPVAIPIRNDWLSPNICFESTIPHWVRKQVRTLAGQGKGPSLLVNMSNDGWFWFSQQIDQHLATHVFRAVESRRPYVSATNGGFAAIIDGNGRIQKIGKRREAEAVIGEIVVPSGKLSTYDAMGDWPALSCMIAVVFCAVYGAVFRFKRETAPLAQS